MEDPINDETTNVLPLVIVLNSILFTPIEFATVDTVVTVFPDIVEIWMVLARIDETNRNFVETVLAFVLLKISGIMLETVRVDV